MATKDTATLSSKFQISIPKAIRTARRWQAGQVFAFIPKGEGMLLVPVPSSEELAGLARGAKPKNYRDRTSRVLMRLVDTSAWIEFPTHSALGTDIGVRTARTHAMAGADDGAIGTGEVADARNRRG